MTLLKKAALFCDGCGKRLDLDYDKAVNLRFSGLSLLDEVSGWRELEKGVHLCPKCNKEYSDKEEEFAAELKNMIGRHGMKFAL